MEMIVIGGTAQSADGGTSPIQRTGQEGGAAYHPDTNAWRRLSPTPLLGARIGFVAVWTGSELLVWGGTTLDGSFFDTGVAYTPARDTWRPLADAPFGGRTGAVAVWTGREVLVWGGRDRRGWQPDGARYDAVADRWVRLTAVDAPTASVASAVWTGSEMIVWSGLGSGQDSARFDPEINRWTTIPMPSGITRNRDDAPDLIAWTGSELLVLRGQVGRPDRPMEGYRVDVSTGELTAMSADGAPTARSRTAAVWTGAEWVGWGGSPPTAPFGFSGWLGDGGRYDPVQDVWSALPAEGAPSPRFGHSAVWTGQEVLFWGGTRPAGQTIIDGIGPGRFRTPVGTLNEGARYHPG
jgi:N-acetylneuraminic acid mutarotase